MRRMLLIVVLLIGVSGVSGCQNDAQFTQTLNETRAALVAAEKQISDLKLAVDALPPGDNQKAASDALATAEKIRADLMTRLAAVEALNTAAKTGDTQGLGAAIASALAGIPVVGPFAPLIGLLGGIGWGIYQQIKGKAAVAAVGADLATETAHLTNVVKSIEVAGPDWSDEDKKAITTIQGAATSARVEEIKTGA
jgi:biopolymer transport protein ExbB/TolQ